MLLTQKLEEISCSSRDAQKTISEYLLKEKEHIGRKSMQQIAEETFSSKATLVRFAKKLGFAGWNEFQAEFLQETRYLELHKENVNVNKPFQIGSSPLEIAGSLVAVKRDCLDQTLEMLNEETLEKCVDAMQAARRICLFGISVNEYLLRVFMHHMFLIGRIVEIVNPIEARYIAESMDDKDCAIVVSYSGNDPDRNPTHLVPTLKEHGSVIIGLTSMGTNMLRDYADYTLTIASREKIYSKIGAFSTETSTLFLLDLLFSCYFERNYDKNLEYKYAMMRRVETKRYSTTQGIRED